MRTVKSTVLVNCAGTGNAIKTASRDKKTGEIKFFQSEGFRSHHPNQPGGHIPLHRHERGGHAFLDPLDGGERGHDRQHGIGGGTGQDKWGRPPIARPKAA